jgi:hypothetical protein
MGGRPDKSGRTVAAAAAVWWPVLLDPELVQQDLPGLGLVVSDAL